MNYKLTLALFLVSIVLIGLPMAAARPTYFAAFKEKYNTSGTKLDSCNTCHTSGGGSPRNPYGLAFSDSGHDFSSIEALDSDSDGFTNIEEINALTFPGNPTDYPQTTPATPTATIPNVTHEQPTTEAPLSNGTPEKPVTQFPVNNTTQEKPTAEVPVSNTTATPKSPGFEAIFAVVGFLIIVGLHRKHA
jgi:type II secretory pathway pseudopilin PulG